MIFTVFGIAKRESGRSLCVLLICPLKSIVSDQIAQLEGLCTAVELTTENVSRVLPNKRWKNMCEQVSFFKLHKQVQCFEVMQICV